MSSRTLWISASAFLITAAFGSAQAAMFDPPVAAPVPKCEDCAIKMRPVVGLVFDPAIAIKAPEGASIDGAKQISKVVLDQIETEWRTQMQAAGARITTQEVKAVTRRPAETGKKAKPAPALPTAKGELITASFAPAPSSELDVFLTAGAHSEWTIKRVDGAPETVALREKAAKAWAEASAATKAMERYKADATIYVEASRIVPEDKYLKKCEGNPFGGAGQGIGPNLQPLQGGVRRGSMAFDGGVACTNKPRRIVTVNTPDKSLELARQNKAEAERLAQEALALDKLAAEAEKSGNTRLHSLAVRVPVADNYDGREYSNDLMMDAISYPELIVADAPVNYGQAVTGWGQTVIADTKGAAKAAATMLVNSARDSRGRANLVRRDGVVMLDVGRRDGVCPGDAFALEGIVERSAPVRNASSVLVYDWVGLDLLARVVSVTDHTAKVEFIDKKIEPLSQDDAGDADVAAKVWNERKAGGEVIASGEWAGVYGDKSAWSACSPSA